MTKGGRTGPGPAAGDGTRQVGCLGLPVQLGLCPWCFDCCPWPQAKAFGVEDIERPSRDEHEKLWSKP